MQTCESTIYSRNRHRWVWWKPIGVLLFYGFMIVFAEAVERKIEDPRRKLTCLIKYTTVEVKEMVKNILQLPPKEGYKTEKQIMHKLYGYPNRLITAYRKEIKQ